MHIVHYSMSFNLCGRISASHTIACSTRTHASLLYAMIAHKRHRCDPLLSCVSHDSLEHLRGHVAAFCTAHKAQPSCLIILYMHVDHSSHHLPMSGAAVCHDVLSKILLSLKPQKIWNGQLASNSCAVVTVSQGQILHHSSCHDVLLTLRTCPYMSSSTTEAKVQCAPASTQSVAMILCSLALCNLSSEQRQFVSC